MIFENAVFVDGALLDTDFKDVASKSFNAEITDTRFNNPVTASTKINDWVNRVTRGKIPSLVEPGTE